MEPTGPCQSVYYKKIETFPGRQKDPPFLTGSFALILSKVPFCSKYCANIIIFCSWLFRYCFNSIIVIVKFTQNLGQTLPKLWVICCFTQNKESLWMHFSWVIFPLLWPWKLLKLNPIFQVVILFNVKFVINYTSRVVKRSVGKKVDCSIGGKCYVQSFISSKRYSIWNIIASCQFP